MSHSSAARNFQTANQPAFDRYRDKFKQCADAIHRLENRQNPGWLQISWNRILYGSSKEEARRMLGAQQEAQLKKARAEEQICAVMIAGLAAQCPESEGTELIHLILIASAQRGGTMLKSETDYIKDLEKKFVLAHEKAAESGAVQPTLQDIEHFVKLRIETATAPRTNRPHLTLV